LRLRIPAWVQSPFSMQSATCSRIKSVFSLRDMEPNVSTCSSHRISAADLMSPCSFFIFERIRVTRARSTSTKIYKNDTQRGATRGADRKCYLALCHCSQGFDGLHLLLQGWGIIKEAHDDLDHLGDGLFELPMFLGKKENLFAEQGPVPSLFAYRDNPDENARGRGKVGCLGMMRNVAWLSRGLILLTCLVCFSSNNSFSMAAVRLV
jgi:hypothetical protein